MLRSLIPPQMKFPLALVLTLAAALMPGWALAWTRIPVEIFRIAVTPFADPLNQLASFLRPPPALDAPAGVDLEYIKELEEQMVEYERLYLAERAKVESLQMQLSQLQGFENDDAKKPVKSAIARIGLRPPSAEQAPVVLALGSKHGVKAGSIALYNRSYLMGRVFEVTPVQSLLLPLTNTKTGPLHATVLPHDRAPGSVSIGSAARIQLEPQGDGTLIATPDKSQIINVGDTVVLNDDTWPQPAQALKIGTVVEVRSNDMQPLRNLVVVRPEYQVSEVPSVVLRIEVDEVEALAEGKSP